MNRFCPNCGKENPENAVFCGGCGTSLNPQGQASPNPQATVNSQMYTGSPVIAERNLVLAIILSLLTCGIYSIYWFIVMTDEANKVNNTEGTSGAMAFLFTLLTCGIYGIYWYYKMGKTLYEAGQKSGRAISDNSVIYLLLGLFGFGIVSYALIQSDLNKFAK